MLLPLFCAPSDSPAMSPAHSGALLPGSPSPRTMTNHPCTIARAPHSLAISFPPFFGTLLDRSSAQTAAVLGGIPRELLPPSRRLIICWSVLIILLEQILPSHHLRIKFARFPSLQMRKIMYRPFPHRFICDPIGMLIIRYRSPQQLPLFRHHECW